MATEVRSQGRREGNTFVQQGEREERKLTYTYVGKEGRKRARILLAPGQRKCWTKKRERVMLA